MKTTATIYDDSNTTIEITGEFYPDEHGMEILDAVDQYGTTRNLSKPEESAAIEALWESIESHYENLHQTNS